MTIRRLLTIAASIACTAVLFLTEGQAQRPAPPPVRDGALEKIKVHGKSLEGNLEGDSPDRDVLIFIHGYNVSFADAARLAQGATVSPKMPFGAATVCTTTLASV